MQDLRQIIEDAKPSVLQLFGFAQAVENHLDRSVRDSGLNIDWQLPTRPTALIDTLQRSRSASPCSGSPRKPSTMPSVTRRPAKSRCGCSSVAHRQRGNRRRRRRHRASVPRSGSGIDNMKTRARLISARFEIDRDNTEWRHGDSVTMPAAGHQTCERMECHESSHRRGRSAASLLSA